MLTPYHSNRGDDGSPSVRPTIRTVAGPEIPPSAPPSPASTAFVLPPELAVDPPVPVDAPPLACALPPVPPLEEPLAPPLLVAPEPVPVEPPVLVEAPPVLDDAPPVLAGAPPVAPGTPPSPSVPSDELPLQPIETTPAHVASCAIRRFATRRAFPHAHDRMDIFQP